MSTNPVRSLIAGSIAAVASLTMFAAPAAHADKIIPISPIAPIVQPMLQVVPVGPELCNELDPANLEIRAAQTSPDNWQWRFVVNGPTKYLCDAPVTTELTDISTGISLTQTFMLFDIVNTNLGGEDYVSEFIVPCDYTTTVYVGTARIQMAQYADQHQLSALCDKPAGKLPENPDTPRTDNSVPTTDTTVPGGQLPHTGSDTTTLLVGGALLVLGSGLGFTAMSMTRRRRHA